MSVIPVAGKVCCRLTAVIPPSSAYTSVSVQAPPPPWFWQWYSCIALDTHESPLGARRAQLC